jgi:hypothetical protein
MKTRYERPPIKREIELEEMEQISASNDLPPSEITKMPSF